MLDTEVIRASASLAAVVSHLTKPGLNLKTRPPCVEPGPDVRAASKNESPEAREKKITQAALLCPSPARPPFRPRLLHYESARRGAQGLPVRLRSPELCKAQANVSGKVILTCTARPMR